MKKLILPTFKKLKQRFYLKDFDQKFLDDTKNFCKSIFMKKQLNKLIVFTGPCSIHNPEEAILYAEKLKNLQKKIKNIVLIMRVYFEKPRSQNSWKGLLYDPNLDGSFDIENGIVKVRKLLIDITKMQIPIATEILDPNAFLYFDDLISWGFIGARTSASQIHRQIASKMSIPIGFKNPLDGDINVAINAAIVAKSSQNFISLNEDSKISQISSKGNSLSHIVLRGSKKTINYDKKSLDQTLKLLKEKNENFPIVIDCSHGNAQNDYTSQIKAFNCSINSIIEKKYPIIALMLESNLIQGNQIFNPLNLRYGLSITDPCIDFETTQNIILDADEKLREHSHLLR